MQGLRYTMYSMLAMQTIKHKKITRVREKSALYNKQNRKEEKNIGASNRKKKRIRVV